MKDVRLSKRNHPESICRMQKHGLEMHFTVVE